MKKLTFPQPASGPVFLVTRKSIKRCMVGYYCNRIVNTKQTTKRYNTNRYMKGAVQGAAKTFQMCRNELPEKGTYNNRIQYQL